MGFYILQSMWYLFIGLYKRSNYTVLNSLSDSLISRLLHEEAIDAHSPINQGENIFIVYLALPLKDNGAS